MATNLGVVLTLANSIVGVSVLAMPFCFKQCGIILAVGMLLLCSLISRLGCYFLIKSAISERMKNFEMLAFRAFGPHGKLTVEFCIIGFMLGTCIAYFVVMGDLGPAILGPHLGFDPAALRPSFLIGVAAFVVLPLGLLRNVDSLSTICAASIAFYFLLILKVMSEATPNIINGSWMSTVNLWRPSGILQCLPILSMALSCQTQLFEIFSSLPNTPFDRTTAAIKSALNLTTLLYIFVGFFGYIAYCHENFTGNLMMNFSPTVTSEIFKMGFMSTIAVSFPLVIFPCRGSIYSFLYSKSQYGHEALGSNIPETKFQCITLVIVTSSLVIGLLIPNIELVLGLVGSTMGVFICVITPGLIFTTLSTKKNNERLMAQVVVGIGLIVMVLGTYTNLYLTEETLSGPDKPKIVKPEEPLKVPSVPPKMLPEVPRPAAKMKVIKEKLAPKRVKAKTPEMKPQPIAPEPPVAVVHEEKIVRKEKPQPIAPEPPPDPPKPEEVKKVQVPVVEESKPEKPETPKNQAQPKKQTDKVEEEKKVAAVQPFIGPIEEKQNEIVKKEAPVIQPQKPKDNLTLSMAQGVPLPLALKSANLSRDSVPVLDREKREVNGDNTTQHTIEECHTDLCPSQQDSLQPLKRDLKSIKPP